MTSTTDTSGGGSVRGTVSVHPRGFGFLKIEPPAGDVTSAFITPPELNLFLDGDSVSATLVVEGEGRASAAGLSLIERARRELFGTVTIRKGKRHLRVDRLVSNTDWPFKEGLAEAFEEGAAVVAAIEGSELVPLRAVAAGTDLGLERVVVRYSIRSTFPEDVLAAARAAAESRGAAGGGTRRDLRAIPTVTIDAPTTTDIDDALAVIPAGADGALRVLVSIADVGAIVPEGSPLDEEARARGTSVYLAGRVLPMFPEAISSDAASLIPDADRLAVTAELRIDAEGEVRSVDLYESVIRSHARLSYDAVAAFLEEGQAGAVPASVEPTLRWLRTAAARLSAVRAARGGVELAREEAYVSFDPATREPTGVTPRGETSAHRIVERLMVAANEAVAAWLVDRGLPGLFRVHDEPEPDRVEILARFAHNFGFEAGFGPRLRPRGLSAFEAQFKSSPLAPAIRTVLGEALGPARYTVHPGLHFGLAAPLYLHFTSPIRRYADLAVHRVIKRYLAGDRALVAGDAALELLAQHLNRAAFVAARAESERHRMLVARLLASRVGERVSGNIVAIKPFGLIVQMKGAGATGTIGLDALPDGPYRLEPSTHAAVSAARQFRIGDSIEATIAGANEELGRVDLALSELGSKGSAPGDPGGTSSPAQP
jgi:ribonuclease R